MKPKHRVMCPECFKQKMLFETQKQADNFIKWNGDDIDTGGGELRSYYCPACGGYHITSKPYKPAYEHNTENLIRRYKEETDGNCAKKCFNDFLKDAPKFQNPSRRFLKDFIDAYISANDIDLPVTEISLFRHLIYKLYLNK